MNTNQSLTRGLAILELVDTAAAPLGVRDIARQLGISAAIVQRLMNTLTAHRYLEQVPETRRYRIGPRALGLGNSLLAHDKLISNANGELQRLASEHQLNGYLAVLRERSAVYLLAVQSRGPIVIRAAPGSVAHLHSTAMGKVLLAWLGDVAARTLLEAEPLPQVTPRTITNPAELLDELATIRARGYATAIEENLPGVLSVGSPVRDESGAVIAALSVAFARSTNPELTIRSVARLLTEAAAATSRACGYGAPTLSPKGHHPNAAQRRALV
jgi:DNA-binding IclR family transcriptional regulator